MFFRFSVIRSKSLLPDPKKHNRGNNDPVALYEKYSAYWNTVSFPGEESHARLRWSVREKMLGSGDSKVCNIVIFFLLNDRIYQAKDLKKTF